MNSKIPEGGKILLPAFFPVLVGAALSVGLSRSGFLGFLFLLPLGVNAFCFNAASSRLCAFFAVLGNGIFALWAGVFLHLPFAAAAPDLVYFSVNVLGFAWVVAPPSRLPVFFRPRAAYRLAVSSAAGALAFLACASGTGSGVPAMIRSQAEIFMSLYNASVGADVVEQSLSSQYISVDNIVAVIEAVGLRGGVVFSCMLLLFISRQLSLVIARIARRPCPDGGLAGFHTSSRQIWVLSFSLAGVLVFRLLGAGLFAQTAAFLAELASWNILLICVMLYLAQGGAILAYWYSRRVMPPLFRFFLNLLLIIVIFSPGINMVLLAVLALLGIAENWIPFRVSGTNGSPPTPGSGE
ncbi:MAG: hypothetical protein LBK05_08465 [Treponema sp.]|nr:hypothetical protein [Treponema sp.]